MVDNTSVEPRVTRMAAIEVYLGQKGVYYVGYIVPDVESACNDMLVLTEADIDTILWVSGETGRDIVFANVTKNFPLKAEHVLAAIDNRIYLRTIAGRTIGEVRNGKRGVPYVMIFTNRLGDTANEIRVPLPPPPPNDDEFPF